MCTPIGGYAHQSVAVIAVIELPAMMQWIDVLTAQLQTFDLAGGMAA